MYKCLGKSLVMTGLIGMGIAMFHSGPVAAQSPRSSAVFTPDGKLKLPTGFRKWVFIGAPLTPNALNGGNNGLGALTGWGTYSTTINFPSSTGGAGAQ
jgi:hypothetical protein